MPLPTGRKYSYMEGFRPVGVMGRRFVEKTHFELPLGGGPSGPRGERKPLEESPDTTGQGGG